MHHFTRHLCYQCLNTNVRFYGASADSSVSRITLPHKAIQQLKKQKYKHASKRHQERRHYKGPVIISCKRSEFNHHKGQTYSNFNPQHLASGAWMHPGSKGDYFTINATKGNPALVLEEPTSSHTFQEMGLNENLLAALAEMEINSPTNIQAMTIPSMLQGQNVQCVAETGSGKTLAYMLPILESMQRFRQKYGRLHTENTPQTVIMLPSRELADQTYRVAEQLCKHSEFNPFSVCGGRGTQNILRDHPQSLVDLLIVTPGVFSKLLSNGLYDMSHLRHVVLDEADTLLDDSFSEKTTRILSKMKISSYGERVESVDDFSHGGSQVALVSATMPQDLDYILRDLVPVNTISKVKTSHIHRLMPHVPQKFLRLGNQDKTENLLKAVKKNVERKTPTIVFCNKTSTCRFVSLFLGEHGVQSKCIYGKMPEKVRGGMFESFQNGEVDVLVATDVGSRGLDTIRAQHVINYEFPNFMSDYIHRVGRVGRVGSQGTSFALSFITYKWEVELLWKIEASARRTTELNNVNANIKRELETRALQRDLEQGNIVAENTDGQRLTFRST